MVDRDHADISIRRHCELLGTNPSGLYYAPLGEGEENLRLMRMLDEQYTRTPFLRKLANGGMACHPGFRGEPKTIQKFTREPTDREIGIRMDG